MPAFSRSDLRARRAALVLFVAGLLAAGAAAAKTTTTVSSTHRTRTVAGGVSKVSIGPGRVEVQSAADPDSAGGVNARIDSHGVTLSIEERDSSSRPRRVVVAGPLVSVDEDGQVVRLFSDVEVPAGQRVDGDVVTIFGSSKIDGHVTGNAVAVFGSVSLGEGAAVDGDMVAIFGSNHRVEGSTVGGETFDFGIAPLIPGLPPLPAILLMIGLFWVLSLVGGGIVALVMPARLVRITATASRRMGGSLMLGIAALPLVILAVILLCITVIGIPIAFLLPVGFGFVMWVGQFAGFYGLGLKLLRRRLGQGSVFAALAAGTLFVTAFFVVGALLAGAPGLSRTIALFLVAVGGLICTALQLIGSGAVFLSRFGTRPKVLEPAEDLAAAPIAPPQPSAPPLGA